MKVFLIIIGIILGAEILNFTLKLINSFLDNKKLQNEISSLKMQLASANDIIKHNNEVIEGMARNASSYSSFYCQKRNVSKEEIEAIKYAMKKSHPDSGGNAEDFIKFRKVYEELTGK